MKQKGSALILSMMLIATIGATAFGIARLLYVDTSIATTYENGAIAYYAAESGIEEGFLRYKYNMNAEVPYKEWTLNDPKVFRTDLTSAADSAVSYGSLGEGTDPAPAPDPTKQFYDLRMGYLGTYDNITKTYKPFFFHDVVNDNTIDFDDIFSSTFSSGDYDFLRIPKDEAKTFDLSNLNLKANVNELNIGFKFIGVKQGNAFTTARECNAMAEVKFLVKDTNKLVKEYKALTSFNPSICKAISYTGIDENKLDAADSKFKTPGGYTNVTGHNPNQSTDNGYYYSLSDILTTVVTKAGAIIDANDKVTMTIKPLYYPADVFFTTQACVDSSCGTTHSKIVTGPYTYVTSTGYYGGITRTLSANIDRQSGTLYDLYDYVLFKGN